MQEWIDGALYPDTDVPESLELLPDKVDFLARLCGAWDFGILPYEETIEEIKRPEWREAVNACQMLTSIAYQILRDWHQLPPVPYIGREFDYINEDPFLEHICNQEPSPTTPHLILNRRDALQFYRVA